MSQTGLNRDDVVRPRHARFSLWFFAIYLCLYGGFVLVNAFAPTLMERLVIAGLNLAVVYGIGLIAAAVGLALLYGWLHRASALADSGGRSQ